MDEDSIPIPIDILARVVLLQTLQELMIPEDFWEPVKVTAHTENIKCFPMNEPWECPLCCDQRFSKHILRCCDKEICDECVNNWFGQESVICPYCRTDIREVTDKLNHLSEGLECKPYQNQKSIEHAEQDPTFPVPNRPSTD